MTTQATYKVKVHDFALEYFNKYWRIQAEPVFSSPISLKHWAGNHEKGFRVLLAMRKGVVVGTFIHWHKLPCNSLSFHSLTCGVYLMSQANKQTNKQTNMIFIDMLCNETARQSSLNKIWHIIFVWSVHKKNCFLSYILYKLNKEYFEDHLPLSVQYL